MLASGMFSQMGKCSASPLHSHIYHMQICVFCFIGTNQLCNILVHKAAFRTEDYLLLISLSSSRWLLTWELATKELTLGTLLALGKIVNLVLTLLFFFPLC